MEKRKPVPIPHEHGAWALLYGSSLVALGVMASGNLGTLLLLVTMTALFLAHEPLVKIVRTLGKSINKENRRHWIRWLLIYFGVALISGAPLVLYYELYLLVPVGLLTGLLMTVHLFLTARKKERTVLGEMLGVLSLTASAPITYFVTTRNFDKTAVLLWACSLLYFASGIFYVKMRVSWFTKRQQFGKKRIHSLLYHVFLVGVLAVLSWSGRISTLLSFAYAPIIFRAFWSMFFHEERLNLKRIGYMEVGYTILFVTIFIAVWHLA